MSESQNQLWDRYHRAEQRRTEKELWTAMLDHMENIEAKLSHIVEFLQRLRSDDPS